MKKILLILTLVLLPFPALAEKVDSFTSDITVLKDGSFEVVETIVYDFEDEYRHGIFRFIPTKHAEESDKWFKERAIDIEVSLVSIDNIPVPFEITKDLGEIEVKIGDPDVSITGPHTYTISYRVRGALYYYENGEVDLYWNATGNKWTVPMETVRVNVHDPDGIFLQNSHCYSGVEGSTNECAVATSTEGVSFGSVSLAPGEGITVAQALDPDQTETLIVEEWSLWPIWLIGASLWFLWLGRFLYRYANEHKTGASVIAEYEPYEDLEPMYTGVLFDGRVDPHDITAGIVKLAEQGFFKIKHIGRKVFFFIETDDYEITLLRPYSELKTEFDKTLFSLIFDASANPGAAVVLSQLVKDLTKQAANHKLITALKAAAEADLVKQGYFEYKWRLPGKIVAYLAGALLAALALMFLIGADLLMPIVISVAVLTISTIALLFVYRRRTKKGHQALDHLKGFKEFLSVTDRDRFKFHNAPQKSPEQFMAYLPYAIAFGVEKEWAEAFKDISLPEPDWYDGNGHAFNAVYLSQSLGTFGSSMSSATGASASSGGGSSGGGAGGGGGGSW